MQLSLCFISAALHTNEEAVPEVDAFSSLSFESVPAKWGSDSREQRQAVHIASPPKSYFTDALSITEWGWSYGTKFGVVCKTVVDDTETVLLRCLPSCETCPAPSCPFHNPKPKIKISHSCLLKALLYTYIRVLTHLVFLQEMMSSLREATL